MAPTLRPVRVSDNRRHLQTDDGQPFFWLGDTAWELFHRLNREEIELYLKTRAEQGFNVIQCVLLAEEGGITIPNREGHLPLIDQDPTKPDLRDGGYWDLVDYVFDRAAAHGLYLGLLPTWGDKINKMWGQGPEVFTPENGRIYGEWLGKRYGVRNNVIWVCGGDRPTEGKKAEFASIAEGIRAGEPARRLMTFHPMGGASSSASFHGAEWLDLNMLQSGHGWFDIRPDAMVDADYVKEPTKPVLDGEPCYENHRPFRAMGELKDLSIPAFNDFHVRRACYLSVFAGGCGVTYGCHAMWQFASDRHPLVNHPIGTWEQSLQLPGALQMHLLKNLMLGHGYFERVPDESVLAEGAGDGVDQARSTSGPDFALVYLPSPRKVRVSDAWKGARAAWFDPRTGERHAIAGFDGQASPPTALDWVLELKRN